MSRDSGPVAPLEQRCVRPGLWIIEGYEVKRHPRRGPKEGLSPNYWAISEGGFLVASMDRLDDAREWIRRRI
jgi:hypothetical protein